MLSGVRGVTNTVEIKPSVQAEESEEPLEYDQSGKGCQRLILKLQFRKGVGFSTNGPSAILHGMDLLVGCLLSVH